MLAWRVSVAEVATATAFSSFPGFDRVLMLRSGRTMIVTVDGHEHPLQRYEKVVFPGEADARATLLDGGTLALNVMTRRGEIAAQVGLCVVNRSLTVQRHSSETVLLVVVQGDVGQRHGAGFSPVWLSLFDTVVLENAERQVVLLGSGRIVCIRLG